MKDSNSDYKFGLLIDSSKNLNETSNASSSNNINTSKSMNTKLEPVKDLSHLIILKQLYDSNLDKVLITNSNQLNLAKRFIKIHPFNSYSSIEARKFDTFHRTKKIQLSFFYALGLVSNFTVIIDSFFMKIVKNNKFLYLNAIVWPFYCLYFVKVQRFGIYEDFINREIKDYLFKKYYDEIYLSSFNYPAN